MSNRSKWNRREWLAGSGLAALGAGVPTRAAAGALEYTPHIYESLGVRPFINARGTFTIITGSQSLPQVKQAMAEASRHFVNLDELMEAVGRRIAELTKAEWGIVTAGCAAAIAHATAACIAGSDPEKMQRLPKLDGLKSEVVMPRYARNVYDHAARMVGATVVEAETAAEFEQALGPKTAMVLIMSSPAAEKGPLSIENASRIARAHNIPLLVDAAAENLTIPNIHLSHGATMVAYSGGKCLRGPQAAGLLLGPKDLLQAAWLNSAPHHAFGRALKAGKEEIMGMLAALEMWVHRDHDAEWKQWEGWLETIRLQVTRVPGVTTEIVQPEDLSNHAPQLRVNWDGAKVGITGSEVSKMLDRGTPRIVVAGGRGERPKNMQSSVTVMPYMMNAGEAAVVARALHEALTHPGKFDAPAAYQGAMPQIAGTWEAEVQFGRGQANHHFVFEQDGAKLKGQHRMEFLGGALGGEIEGGEIAFRSAHRFEGTVLDYAFRGRLKGDGMEGEVSMGEYGVAKWRARRTG
jgi:D-glucosaminate-6-phosphate ammonia-lyase